MDDSQKTRAELLSELDVLRRRVSELESAAGDRERIEAALRKFVRAYKFDLEGCLERVWGV